MTRKLWDTRFPQELVLLARHTSRRGPLNDPDIMNELHDELNRAITDSEGVQMTPMKHDSFYDIDLGEHFYDVWVILKTKGGYLG